MTVEGGVHVAEESASSEMTVDDLARRAGTTTRTIRLYQTMGLLPPPRTGGRVGYYGGGHLARLRYIAGLKERGFSLAGIRELLRAWEQGRTLSDVLGFEDALTAPWSDVEPIWVTRERLAEILPPLVDDDTLLRRATELGLVVPDGDGFRIPDPRVLRVGAVLVDCGVPLAVALDDRAALDTDMRRVAARFVEIFERHVWEPFVAAGLPAEGLEEVTDALRRLRPAASEAVLAALGKAMDEAVAASTAAQARALRAGEEQDAS